MHDRTLEVLLVEDNPVDALLLREELHDARSASFHLTHVERLAEALSQLAQHDFDAVLLDLGLPDSAGFATFHALHQPHPRVPILVLTGMNDEDLALRAVQEGAEDYLVKGQVQGQLLPRAILYAIERKRSRQMLHESREFYLRLLEEFPALIRRAGVTGRCDYFNKTWLEFTGRALEDELGDGWTEGMHPDDRTACLQTYAVAVAARAPFQMEYRLRRADGHYRWMADFGRPFHDVDGHFAGYLGASYDISQQKQHEAQIEEQHRQLEATNKQLEVSNVQLAELATTDSLTRLRNRRFFNERLNEEVGATARTGEPLSLVMIDVDRFKTYNDSFGHPAGDAVLKQLAQIIRDTYRPTDVYARYGGEEFVVLLPRTDQHGAITAAERCRAAIACSEWPFRPITASMGVATLRPGMKAPELTECADRALYHCKHSGRNCVSHVEHIKLAQTAPPDN